jgi:hypothetical protein
MKEPANPAWSKLVHIVGSAGAFAVVIPISSCKSALALVIPSLA